MGIRGVRFLEEWPSCPSQTDGRFAHITELGVVVTHLRMCDVLRVFTRRAARPAVLFSSPFLFSALSAPRLETDIGEEQRG